MSGTSVDHSCSKALADNSPNKSQAQAVPGLLLVRRVQNAKPWKEDPQAEPGHWLSSEPADSNQGAQVFFSGTLYLNYGSIIQHNRSANGKNK